VWALLFAGGVLLCALPSALGLDALSAIGVLLLFVSGAVLGWRIVRVVAQKLFYRLSWRLAFSYLLIGVLPIPMLALLLGLTAFMSVGQFEVYRVAQAIDRLSFEMAQGERPGTLRARVVGGRVRTSSIETLPAGTDAPDWLTELTEPHFVGLKPAAALAVARKHGETTDVFALPLDDVFLAAVAERSGVAIQLVSVEAKPDTDTHGGVSLHVKVSPEEKKKLREREDNFIYPPEATPSDHSGSPLKSVAWAYTSTEILGSPANVKKDHVLMFTRMSWRRALADLFAQGIVRGKHNNWARAALVAIAGLLLFVYLVALLIAFVLVLTITRTVNRLTRATRKIAAGDFSVRIATKARDQVGDLARSFDSMAGSLASVVNERAARELLDREIEQAHLISQKLLPPAGTVVPGFLTATYFEPVARIGGDYYDFLQTADGRTAIAIGDVSGHGLPTALLVAMAKAALATLLESGEEGIPLFAKMNALLHRSTDARNYMTLAVAVIGSDSTAVLTNAGHPPPYVIRGDEVRPVALPAFPLGIWPNATFASQELPFGAGDRLVFYTDGIIEACDARDDAFGFERFEEVLKRHATEPIEELQNAVLDALAAHARPGEPEDDRTLVLVEKRP
jgi:HAMP domain-containing protein